jgi:hypothetical protein
VLIEFILSVYDANTETQSLMAGDTRSLEHVHLSNFSTISKFNSNLKHSRSRRARREH